MSRVLLATVLFALLAILAVGSLSWLAYRSVRLGLESEFSGRLEGIASTAASQVRPADIADARLLGEAGGGYLALQVLIQQLCATPGTVNASLLDSTGAVIYDCRGSEGQGLPSPLDTLAREVLGRARAGQPAVSPPLQVDGHMLRIGVAPVMSEPALGRSHVVGLLAVEAEARYLEPLRALRRRLGLITLVIAAALAVLAAAVARTAWSGAVLERRLSRAENLAAMGRMTATLAHEIKNPLSIIRGSARRLGKLEPAAAEMADDVVSEVDRLTATVNRYLQFARGSDSPAGAGDARAALEATLALLEGEARARGLTLEREGQWPERAPVPLDDDALRQIALNLLLNAFEAIEGGGRIGIGLEEVRGRVELRVTDSGPGIPPDTLRRLGEPFVTTKAQGTGLGLFLTRRLVESAGGTLEIANAVGRGAVCRVLLPRRRG